MLKFNFLGNISHIYPLIWRFLPGIDFQVDTLFVRDLDSEITKREAEAVEQFLDSSKVFISEQSHTL